MPIPGPSLRDFVPSRSPLALPSVAGSQPANQPPTHALRSSQIAVPTQLMTRYEGERPKETTGMHTPTLPWPCESEEEETPWGGGDGATPLTGQERYNTLYTGTALVQPWIGGGGGQE